MLCLVSTSLRSISIYRLLRRSCFLDVSDFSKSLNKTFDPIDLTKSFNLVDIQTPCDFGDLAFKASGYSSTYLEAI